MWGSLYQGTWISFILATIIFFVLNGIWTTYRSPGLYVEIAVAIVAAPLMSWGSLRLYHELFGAKDT